MDDDDRQGRILNRREALGLLGAGGAAGVAILVAGPAFSQSGAPPLSCIATPEQTEGPYFVDERLNRSDIRVDPTDNSAKQGVPLILRLSVSSVGRNGCQPLAGAIVDVWHCDALGFYSDVRDAHSSRAGKKFLRGYQVTDEKGRVRFTTIYPGWYPGRTVHIHFKVRTAPGSGQGHEFTSQLYFDDAVSERVQARMPYAGNARRRVSNERDGIFRDGGSRLMPRLAENAQGYVADFDIGLQMA